VRSAELQWKVARGVTLTFTFRIPHPAFRTWGGDVKEHHIFVKRTARYFALGDSAGAGEVWFVCHGYGQLAARFLEKLRVLDDGRRYLVAPEGLSRFYLSESPTERRVGASWMTREDRLAEIEDYVQYLDAVYADVFGLLERTRVTVHALGFSQGASTVSRWAALGKAKIDRLILWGGEFPPDLDLTLGTAVGQLRAARLTVVYGRSDEYITPKVVSGIVERLRQYRIPCKEIAFDGAHELDEAVLRELAAS
jgi:predicted esterase